MSDYAEMCSQCGQYYSVGLDQEKEINRLKSWINDLQSGMYVNCVYCGHRYGPRDEVPESMADVLKNHIEECPQHPMSKLKEENDKLRKLVRASYSEGFNDGMGNKPEIETWEDSQTRMCLKKRIGDRKMFEK